MELSLFAHATSSPLCITWRTVTRRLRPSCPAGWRCAKSSGVNSRVCMTASASASPIAVATAVLAVGARLCGSASARTEASSSTSICFASGDTRLPMMPISGEFNPRKTGISRSSSSVVPLFERQDRRIALAHKSPHRRASRRQGGETRRECRCCKASPQVFARRNRISPAPSR